MRKPKKAVVLPGVRANAGLQSLYRRRLEKLLSRMHADISKAILTAYHANPPEMSADASPAMLMREAMKALSRRWNKSFDAAAPELAAYFAKAAADRSDGQLRAILRKRGFAVSFAMTREVNDIVQATIGENVALIRSIAQQHLTDVEGAVMRSVAAGRDLATLSKELQQTYGVAKRRAALIARDQNNKATATITRARQAEIGVTRAIWMHSHAGKTPRPSHVAQDGKPYDIATGWFDPDEQKWVWPGTLINCLPEETSIEFAQDVEIAYRHWFGGDLTQIITEDGKTLRGTPNHPVLTPKGWVALGALDQGDYVIEVADDVVRAIRSEQDIDDAIPTIGQIFTSLADPARFDVRMEIASGGQFHGDVTYGNVDIIWTASPLTFGAQMAERLQNFTFARPNNSGLGRGALGFREVAILAPASRIVSLSGEARPSFRPLSRHSQSVGVAGISDRTADRFDHLGQFGARDIMPPGHAQETSPVFMFGTKASRIVQTRRIGFDGHVFNFQTQRQWYVAGGIITHNCRCFSRPILPGFGA